MNKDSKKLSVMLIAEEANPEWVSVPLIGWSLSNALRSYCDVHIVTQVRNRNAFLSKGLIEGVDFTALDSEKVAAPMWKIGTLFRGGEGKGWTTMSAVKTFTYYYFEHLVRKAFKQRIADGEFDIVHRITPLSPTVPSRLAKMCHRLKVPFILGPINGGVPWPKEFREERHAEKEWLSYVRNLYKLLPGYSGTMRYSAAVIAASEFTLSQFPKKFSYKHFYIPENAINPEFFNMRAVLQTELPLRACFVGRLVPYKGPDILVEAALPFVKDGLLILDIIGDGPIMSDIKTTLSKHQLTKGINLHGWVEHEEVQKIMCQSSLLVFPSIREFGGGVVLEAMALGIVPMIVDYAGPAELVNEKTGIKIPLGHRSELVRQFRKNLEYLITKPEILQSMSEAGYNTVFKHFTWDKKAEQILQIYHWALKRRESKPEFSACNTK